MRIDHGIDEDAAANAAARGRPPATHRPVDPAQTAAEQARGVQDRARTIPHRLGPLDPASAEAAAEAAETKNEREARRKREARAAAKRAKEKAGS